MFATLEQHLLYAAVVCYLTGVAAHLYHIIKGKRRALEVGVGAFALGVLIQLVGTVLFVIRVGHLPVLGWQEATAFFAMGIMALYLWIQRTYKVPAFGAFVGPVVLGLCLLSLFMHPEMKTALRPELKSFWFPVHVLFAFVGDALFALAAVVGVMFLIQDYQLKHKAISPLFHRLPSLEVLDEVGYRCLAVGFPLLTLGIVTGSVWSMSTFGDYWRWMPKEVWSLVTWLLYAALLHGRLTSGWRGRRASIGSIAGFALVLGSFFLTSHMI
ncbi:MAG: cytochrome c biogenesis protein CcsA [Myxococcales bacterium]|nr:cytochrome c biogenesis protein CcsA [Myxococcales bacterium]